MKHCAGWFLLFLALAVGTWPLQAAEPEPDNSELQDTGGLPAAPASEPAAPLSLDALLEQLAAASLSESVRLLPVLEAEGGLAMLGLFEAMLAGELYYDAGAARYLRIMDGAAGETLATEVFSGAGVDAAELEDPDKIRVNNRLRGMLRQSIARINMTEGSVAQRESAVLALLASIDEDSVVLLQEALLRESDVGVRELLELGIAMDALVGADTEQAGLEALARMEGRLETPVRNLLVRVIDDQSGDLPAVAAEAERILREIEADIRFYQFIEQLFFGLSLGSVLLLAAIGLAVTFGVMGVINMAHGEMLMLGAYTTYVVQLVMPNSINLSLWVALPAAFLVTALAGILIQRFVIRYLNGRPLETLLATFGISLILQQTVRTIFSPLNRRVISPDWMSGSLQLNPVLALTWNRLYILLFALLVFVALVLILKKTSLGLNVRAVSQNRAMARAMGVRTDYVDAMTFALGSGIAGMAGVALSQLTNVGPNLGQNYIIDSFMVVVFGGVGNLLGTLLGAFSLGMANKFLEPVTGAVLANIVILVFIILFIQKRPKGLFPQKGRAAD